VRAVAVDASLDASVDGDHPQLSVHLDAALPPYARPVFIRVHSSLDTTATLKLAKLALQREGLAPREGEPIYVRDDGDRAYEE
jgi:hypothetical protein